MELKSKDAFNSEVSRAIVPDYEKLHINKFPYEVLQCILKYFSFGEIAKFRLVSKHFNRVCGDLLNLEFYRLKTAVQARHTFLESQMPRRESSRRNHILSRENDIVETMHLRLALLNLSVGKHVEKNHCCFFAGKFLDEVNRLLNYVKNTLYLDRPVRVTDELFDLSEMALEHFKEHIEPTLPEIMYFSDFMGNSRTGSVKSDTCTATNIAQGNQAEPTPSIIELNNSLKNTRRIVYRIRMVINTIKSSIESLYQNIDKLERIVHQIKKEQNDLKEIDLPRTCLNELLFQLNQCTLMIDTFKMHLVDPSEESESSNSRLVSCNSDNNSSNCTLSQNVSSENTNNSNNINYESMASTSNICTKRKETEIVPENKPKKERHD